MKPFEPKPLPRDDLDWAALVPLIAEANRALARYDGIVQGLVNSAVLLSPLSAREAQLSSLIEGTQTSLEELFEFEADPSKTPSSRLEDIREVLNYRSAMAAAVDELRARPLSLNLLKRIHFILMDSVRGRDKRRGEFRREQNYIGVPNAPIEQAIYVPPPRDVMDDLLRNLEDYVHTEEKDRLVQVALIHAQFELIHPFLDGNGRVGRMLIPLFLFANEIISAPAFYLSAYLESHRDEYYALLQSLSRNDEFQNWVVFFLRAVTVQANEDAAKARRIFALYDHMKLRMTEVTRSQFVIHGLDVLFDQPIFSTPQFIERSGVPKNSAARILGALTEAGVLRLLRQGRGRRVTIYAFQQLIDIVNASATDDVPSAEPTLHTMDVMAQP